MVLTISALTVEPAFKRFYEGCCFILDQSAVRRVNECRKFPNNPVADLNQLTAVNFPARSADFQCQIVLLNNVPFGDVQGRDLA